MNLIEVFRRKKRLFLVFEFVDHTVLDELERYPNGLDENTVRKVLWQVLRAIEFCHNHYVSTIKYLTSFGCSNTKIILTFFYINCLLLCKLTGIVPFLKHHLPVQCIYKLNTAIGSFINQWTNKAAQNARFLADFLCILNL